jgi:hypothetical protein
VEVAITGIEKTDQFYQFVEIRSFEDFNFLKKKLVAKIFKNYIIYDKILVKKEYQINHFLSAKK